MKNQATIRTWTSKKGNPVVFRYPSMDEFDDQFAFAKAIAQEDTFVSLNAVPTEAEERAYMDQMLRDIAERKAAYLSVYVDGVFAGDGRVKRGEKRHQHVGSIGISLLPPYRDEGIGTELMISLIDEGRKLGLRLLTLSCFENNPRALHVYEKLGFVRSGVIPEAIVWKDQYIGEVSMYLPLVSQ